MRSHRRLKKEREEKSWRMSSFGLLLSFYLGRCSSEFFFLSLFFFHFSVLPSLFIPTWIETVFFFYYYFVRETRDYFGSSVSNWYFQWFFTENGGISSLYISSRRKNWRKLLIFKLNIGFQIYRDVVSTFDQHLNYFFLRLLLHRKLFSKLVHG